MAVLCANISLSRVGFPAPRRRWRVPAAAIAQPQPPDDRLSSQEFFEAFLRSRRGNVDLISRASDLLWKNELQEVDEAKLEEIRARLAENQKMGLDDSGEGGGFLRLSQTKNWSLGLDSTAPANFNREILEAQRERDDFRRLCLLDYEALKRELSLVTLGVGFVTGVYCLAFFSTETAVSYGVGVFESWIYWQLLANQVDKTSELTLPNIFIKQKRKKRIGFTSDDLRDSLEKNLQGIHFALSSPRLLLVIALYGLWLGSSQLGEDFPLKLEITPMLLGFFAYKAAALVQTYRDNKDLLIVFPANKDDERNQELDEKDDY